MKRSIYHATVFATCLNPFDRLFSPRQSMILIIFQSKRAAPPDLDCDNVSYHSFGQGVLSCSQNQHPVSLVLTYVLDNFQG
ncbi:hypothetical protein VTO42DRAFT_8800 [Malbranchea cinnamomea]